MNKTFFYQGKAVANCSGVMESRDHFKNGASLKSHTSRRNILRYVLVASIVVFVTVACGGGKGKIIMKTESSEISFNGEGTGNITIDWGDGNKETKETTSSFGFGHQYSDKSVHTVTITGKNITFVEFDGIGLTSLDVSKCTTLEGLKCDENQLTSDALNALFQTLHSKTVDGEKYIEIEDNPGAGACNRSIATKKGWRVY